MSLVTAQVARWFSADGSLAAVAGLDRTVVTTADGAIRWQCESVIKPQGMPQVPAVHIGRDGFLWLYVPDGEPYCRARRPDRGGRSTAEA